jgi:DNA-binding NtrC family response regulator
MNGSAILLVERIVAVSEALRTRLVGGGFRVTLTPDAASLPRQFERSRPEVVVLGPSTIDDGRKVDCAREIRRVIGQTPIVLVADVSSEELAIDALRAGVNEYVRIGAGADELVASVRRCLGAQVLAKQESQFERGAAGPDRLIGNSAAMQAVRERLARVAPSDCNILITGETGTGKELIAEKLHQSGNRRNKPFITINCAAIPDTLFESELFGYERGSFTGAHQVKQGRLKAAHGGTVFLDEVGDMSAYGQSGMLRMLESREIQRLGSENRLKVDVRIIAATNRDLDKLMEQNVFRRDLFFRLAVTSIHLPPLRSRKEDIPSLLEYYIRYFNRRMARSIDRISDETLAILLAYDWPGNVRELRNLLESIFVELDEKTTVISELPGQFRMRFRTFTSALPSEQQKLLSALVMTNWNKSKAATSLDWSRMKLYRKMAQYKIEKSGPRSQSC